MTAPTNAVPPAVLALRDAFRRALPADTDPVDGVAVRLGVDTNRLWVPRAVTVAAAFDEEIEAFSVERTETGARPNVVEQINVACSAYAGDNGTPDYPAWRAQMGDMIAALDAALLYDEEFRDQVARATRGFSRWLDWLDPDEGTAGVILDFVISLTVLS